MAAFYATVALKLLIVVMFGEPNALAFWRGMGRKCCEYDITKL